MRKKIKAILLIFLIVYGLFEIYRTIKLPSSGEYYIVNFNDTDTKLAEEDKKTLCKAVFPEWDREKIERLQIIKLAYQYSFRDDGGDCYIVYEEQQKGACIYKHNCMYLSRCEKGKQIKETVKKYYKWWNNNEKDMQESQ